MPIMTIAATASASSMPRSRPMRWARKPMPNTDTTLTSWRLMNSVPISGSVMPRSRSQTGQ